MAKSIKLTKDNYLDSQGIVHEKTLLSTIINTLLNASIVEAGSHAYGEFIKFNNGLMICFRNNYTEKVNITSGWDTLYVTNLVNQISFPREFISAPVVLWDVTPEAQTGCFKVHYIKPTITKSYITDLYVARPNSRTDVTVRVHYIAIGYWK